MSIREQMQADLKEAMKARDNETRDALRYIISAFKYAEIEERRDLTPEEELKVLRQQVKQRQDSIEQFQAGGREDLVEKEAGQLKVLERYLPQQMSDDELARFVAEGIAESGAAGPKDMGKVMGLLNKKADGRVDGRRLSSAVKDALAAL
ncbi:MAG: GatB/YqeY domain-containing protein [Thermomicrobiales bacterium]|nr:GatB/YqeY domain-containing protein [Thermomicrobiales bacterium]